MNRFQPFLDEKYDLILFRYSKSITAKMPKFGKCGTRHNFNENIHIYCKQRKTGSRITSIQARMTFCTVAVALDRGYRGRREPERTMAQLIVTSSTGIYGYDKSHTHARTASVVTHAKPRPTEMSASKVLATLNSKVTFRELLCGWYQCQLSRNAHLNMAL